MHLPLHGAHDKYVQLATSANVLLLTWTHSLQARSGTRSQIPWDACAGAVSGIGVKGQLSGAFSREKLRFKAEEAFRADVHRIQLEGSYSECMAKGVPWCSGGGRTDLV
jgi:hypothetical protein